MLQRLQAVWKSLDYLERQGTEARSTVLGTGRREIEYFSCRAGLGTCGANNEERAGMDLRSLCFVVMLPSHLDFLPFRFLILPPVFILHIFRCVSSLSLCLSSGARLRNGRLRKMHFRKHTGGDADGYRISICCSPLQAPRFILSALFSRTPPWRHDL